MLSIRDPVAPWVPACSDLGPPCLALCLRDRVSCHACLPPRSHRHLRRICAARAVQDCPFSFLSPPPYLQQMLNHCMTQTGLSKSEHDV